MLKDIDFVKSKQEEQLFTPNNLCSEDGYKQSYESGLRKNINIICCNNINTICFVLLCTLKRQHHNIMLIVK